MSWKWTAAGTLVVAAVAGALLLGPLRGPAERATDSEAAPSTAEPAPVQPVPVQPNPELARSAGPVVTYNTYPGADNAQWGKYGIALEREGRYYLLSAGHVGGKIGARTRIGAEAPDEAVVGYSTRKWDPEFRTTTTSDSLDMSLLDVGSAPVPAVLALSTARSGRDAMPARDPVVVPSADGSGTVTLPRLAEIAGVAGDLDTGTVVCQTGADWYSSDFTAREGNVRCGRLSRPCPTSADVCRIDSLDGAVPAVAPNDSGNPVWVPHADGTVDVLGVVHASSCTGSSPSCLTGLFTRVDAFVRHDWTADETLDGRSTGPGGRIVVAAP